MGAYARACILDLTELEKIPQAIRQIAAEAGRIDILVNNAGINMKKEFLEVEDVDFQKIMHTNVTSVFTVSREVTQVMKAQGAGSIINISSMASHYGIPKVIAYSASKAAIEGMTRAMAVELAQYGIRVNCIAPGFIKTFMTEKLNDIQKDTIMKKIPMKKFGEPNDVIKDGFSNLVIVGILTIFFIHFSINIGMNVGITPVIGLPLPFLSYGGSSLLANMILLGIASNLYRNRKQFA